MSKTIDEKVVEMKFDNSHFETNVKTTMSTLDRLKQSLNLKGASQGLENVNAAAKNCDMSTLSNSIDVVQTKFSALQVIGVTALANITNSVVNSAKSILGTMTSAIVQGGINRAKNLENAHFQLQGLLKDEDAVTAVMKNVSDSVDGTAYSLDAAAKVASQLAASGMRAGDEMFKSLRGVAGVAAMTNSSYEDIGRIFTTIAGQGRVMGNDLLSLSSRGMNAAATLAEAMGKTEAEIREMVSKGKISFQDFANAMDDAFGEHAKKANETFDGALSNIRSALGRIGALFVSPMIEQNGPLVQMFNAIRVKINEIKKDIEPFAKVVTGSLNSMAESATKFIKSTSGADSWSELKSKVESTGLSMDAFKEKLIEVARENEDIGIDKLIEETGSFEESLKKGWLTSKIFSEALTRIVGDAGAVASSTESMNQKLEYFQGVVNKVWQGDFANGEERIRALEAAGYDYAEVQELVNKTVDGHRLTLEDLSEEQLKGVGYTQEQIDAFNELKAQADETGTPLRELIDNMDRLSTTQYLFGGLKNILNFFKNVIVKISEAWNRAFNGNKINILNQLAHIFYNLTEKLNMSEESLETLSKVAEALFSVLRVGFEILSAVLETVIDVTGSAFGSMGIDIRDIINKVADLVIGFKDWITANDRIKKGLGDIVEKVKTVSDNVKTFISNIVNSNAIQNIVTKVKDVFDKFKPILSETFENLKKWFSDLGPEFSTLFDQAKKLDSISFSNIKDLAVTFKENMGSHLSTFGDNFSNLTNTLEQYRDSVVDFFGGVGGAIDSFTSTVGSAWTETYEFLKKVKDAFKENFGFAELTTIGAGISIILMGVKIIKIFEQLVAVTVKFGELFEAFKEIPKGFTEMFKAFGTAAKMSAVSLIILSSAFAILMLAEAVKMLASLDWQQVVVGAGAIVALGLALGFFAKQMSKLQSIDWKNNPMIGVVAVMLGFAASLLILVGVLKLMETLDPERIIRNTHMLVLMIAGLVAGIIVLAKNTRNSELGACALTMLAFAVSMTILSSAIRSIGKLSSDEIYNAIGAIGYMTILIMGIITVAGWSEKASKGSGAMILGVAATLFAMVFVVKLVNTMTEDEIYNGIGVLGYMTILIMGIITVSGLGERASVGSGSMLLGVAATLFAMIAVIKLVNKMTEDELYKGIGILGYMTILIMGIISVMGLTEKCSWQSGVTLLGVSVLVLAMAAAVTVLSHIKEENMKKALIAIGVIGAIIAGLIAVTHVAKFTDNMFQPLIAMTIAIGVLTVAIGVLSMLDHKKMLGASFGLAVAIAAFGVAMALLGKVGDLSIKALVAVGIMAVVLVGITHCIKQLSDLDFDKSVGAATSLAILLVVMAAAMTFLGETSKSAIIGAAAMVVMSAAIIGMAFALNLLKDVPIDTIIAGVLAFAAALLVLVVASGLMMVVSEGAIALAVVLLLVSGAMFIGAAAIGVFALAMEICGQWLPSVATGIDMLGDAIANFVTDVASCNGSVEDFKTAMDGIRSEVLNAIVDLAGGLAMAGAGAVVLGLGAVVAGAGLAIAAGGVALFGLALGLLCNTLATGIETVVTTMERLSGQSSTAGGDLVKGFANGINGSSGILVQACTGFVGWVGNTICGLLGIHSPSTVAEGWGENTGEGFAIGLENSSSEGESAATSFIDKIKGIFSGDSSLSETMSNQASDGATNFSNSLTDGVDFSQFSSMISGDSIDFSSFQSMLNTEGTDGAESFTSGLTEGMDLSQFQSMLGEDGSFDFSSFQSMMNTGGSDGAESFVSGLTDGMSSVSLEDTTSQLLDQLNSKASEFSAAGSNLMSEFANGLNVGGETAREYTSNLIQSIVDTFNNSSADVAFSGTLIASSFANEIQAQTPIVVSAFDNVITSIVSDIASKSSEFQNGGRNLMNQFKMGIGSEESGIKTSISKVLGNCLSAIRSYYNEFNRAGKYLGEGLTEGIKAKETDAYNAGYALGQAAVEGEKKGQQSQSPSKATKKAGKWLGEGLIIGMESMGKAVYSAGESMGENAVGSISDALDTINSSNFDVRPTISPVVDMGSVQSTNLRLGANIDALLSSPIASMSQLMTDAQTQINASNEKVINAVNGLRDDLNAIFESDAPEIGLYVDSRKLASSIAGPMNKQLNIIARREGGL